MDPLAYNIDLPKVCIENIPENKYTQNENEKIKRGINEALEKAKYPLIRWSEVSHEQFINILRVWVTAHDIGYSEGYHDGEDDNSPWTERENENDS